MTPVCPACRATISLDAYSCARCGLSVRPTCANCGEPLAHGMKACWFCREPVTEPDPAQQMAVARAATAFSVPPPPPRHAPPPPVVVAEEPEPVTQPIVRTVEQPPVVLAPPRPVEWPRDRRVRWGRVLLVGLLGAVVLTVGALLYESLWIRYLPPDADDVALVRASYADVGCAVSYPSGWTVQTTKRRVTFLSGESAKDRSTRGFRLTRTDIPYEDVEEQIAELPDRLAAYSALDTYADSVDGAAATVHVFIADDLRFEQWWIDRDKRTVRVDLWSRPADEDAPELNERIVGTVELL